MGGMEKNHFARKVIPRKKKENLLISIYTRAADSRILGSGGKRTRRRIPPGTDATISLFMGFGSEKYRNFNSSALLIAIIQDFSFSVEIGGTY